MERRSFVSAVGTVSALLFGSESVGATRDRCTGDPRPSPPAKTVVHLSSGETKAQRHALLNAKNLLEDDTVPVKELVFVANGKGVTLYTPSTEDNEFYDLVTSLQERGVAFRACGNAMEALGLTKDDLIDGVEPVPSAVGELARLQELEYGYIKAP
ncbi:DsrE family protein [Halomicrococcus sp. SG-WS-1]|uniref:DsrE family protein n=1 Tax=Halomicrococcus sp. SG-WS-1 TaxID=3439057 RepID=UPI003F7A49A9